MSQRRSRPHKSICLGVDGMKAITAMVIEGPQQHQFLEGKLPSEMSFYFFSLINLCD